MANDKDDVILLVPTYRQESFLRKKISLTIPTCILLIVIFFLSAVIVSICSLYFVQTNATCYVSDGILIEPEQPKPRTVYYSRPKRSFKSGRANLPCLESTCCMTPLDPNAPWNRTRLPTNVYPIDYQVQLAMYGLNEVVDQYSGTVDIVVEVRSPTNDIILHGQIIISEVTVSQRTSNGSTPLTVDCVIIYPETQTLTLHLFEQLQVGIVYDVRISFFRGLSIHGTGIFENQFNRDPAGIEISRIILTHFKPVHAREAFPCFDEPGFKSKFQLTVVHDNDTKVLSNWDEEESFGQENSTYTEFQTTPPIATASIAFAIFYNSDFDKETATAIHPVSGRTIYLNLWARKLFFTNEDGIYVKAALEMAQRILTALLDIFKEIETPIVPNKIDILAIPEYPSDAVSHWGFIIFTERSILHNPATTSEIEHQRIAMTIAKQLAAQWFGNFISFRWWTELWMQEAISNFLKYHAVDNAFPSWNIHDQFITGELLPAMFDDSLSSSHPIIKQVSTAAQISELFDSIETTKATAILRMADYYMGQTMGVKNNTLRNIILFLRNNEYGFFIPDELLSTYQIATWDGPSFFDRWLLQSNYPKVFVQFVENVTDHTYRLQLVQSRHLSAHMYEYDLYPTETAPFQYVWYVPITCRFSNDTTTFQLTRTFLLDRPVMYVDFEHVYFQYYYCNADFAGYYIMDYTEDNWMEIADALDNQNTDLTELDRANLINNAFLSAQTTEESYTVVKSVTQFLYRTIYSGLLPWQSLSYHVNRMLDVLEFESLYVTVQKYFQVVVRTHYLMNEATLWNASGTFHEQILKTTIVQLACRLHLPDCIDKATELWKEVYPALTDGLANYSVSPHVRDVVYQIHFQNTYDDTEWLVAEADFHKFIDTQERFRLLDAMTQSRQPWHLFNFLYREAEPNKDRNVDLLQVLTLLAYNPSGRELAWYYYRENWDWLSQTYGRSNQRLGQLLIDITATFEDEFHDIELNNFIASTPGVNTNVDARFWALERTNMNYWWIVDNSKDIIESLGFDIKLKNK